MTSLTRLFGLIVVLLAAFLAVAAGLQWWVQRETARLRREAAEAIWTQLAEGMALAPRAPERWDDAHRAALGRLVGGSIEAYAGAPRPVGAAKGAPFPLALDRPHPAFPGWRVAVSASSPALERWQLMQTRAVATLVTLAAALALVPVVLHFLTPRRPGAGTGSESRPPWGVARAEAVGMEQFARISVERGAALAQEHGARLRAEEDLQVSRHLLDRSLDERIRLGRELHDNISQTLYAVCLTLESVRRTMTAPAATVARLDQCVGELRRLNGEVRSHIRDLEPRRVQSGSLAAGISALLAALPGEGTPTVEPRLDEAALEAIPAASAADVLNILREALSNSVRHSGARRITLRAERDESAVAFAVSDDGAGFTRRPPAAGGHGLANMHARAAALGASLHVTSEPGKGTRVSFTVPVASTP